MRRGPSRRRIVPPQGPADSETTPIPSPRTSDRFPSSRRFAVANNGFFAIKIFRLPMATEINAQFITTRKVETFWNKNSLQLFIYHLFHLLFLPLRKRLLNFGNLKKTVFDGSFPMDFPISGENGGFPGRKGENSRSVGFEATLREFRARKKGAQLFGPENARKGLFRAFPGLFANNARH